MPEDAQAALVEYVRAPMYGRKNYRHSTVHCLRHPKMYLHCCLIAFAACFLVRAKWASGM